MSRTMSSSSSSTAINGHAAAAVAQTPIINESGTMNGEPKKPFKPQWPLTSWADTRQNSVAISFLLGCIFAIGISDGLKLFSSDDLVKHAAQLSSRERFWYAITGPRLGIYLAIQVIFHMMEFFTTAIYNPSQATVKSFLLEDKSHMAAHAFAALEFLLEETYLSPRWLAYKHSSYLVIMGLAITIAGQTLRSAAMITAASNFNHIVQYSKNPQHTLVRTGIYSWSRHPSYVAFFYWALGTQIFIGNPVAFVAFCPILYKFFSTRIRAEEFYLVKFFGQDYVKYQKEVPARIPFIA